MYQDPRELPEYYQVEIDALDRAARLRILLLALGTVLCLALIVGIIGTCGYVWYEFLSHADLGALADQAAPVAP